MQFEHNIRIQLQQVIQVLCALLCIHLFRRMYPKLDTVIIGTPSTMHFNFQSACKWNEWADDSRWEWKRDRANANKTWDEYDRNGATTWAIVLTNTHTRTLHVFLNVQTITISQLLGWCTFVASSFSFICCIESWLEKACTCIKLSSRLTWLRMTISITRFFCEESKKVIHLIWSFISQCGKTACYVSLHVKYCMHTDWRKSKCMCSLARFCLYYCGFQWIIKSLCSYYMWTEEEKVLHFFIFFHCCWSVLHR